MESIKQLLIVTGSARPNSTNKAIVEELVSTLKVDERVVVSVAELQNIGLPFFDAQTPPSSPEFVMEHESVRRWSAMVKSSSAVIFVMPEYNRAMSAIQKNAIDWLYSEWKDKPVGVISYGFHQGRRAVANFESINANIGAKLIEPIAMLQYGNEISVNGDIADKQQFLSRVKPTIDAVVLESQQ